MGNLEKVLLKRPSGVPHHYDCSSFPQQNEGNPGSCQVRVPVTVEEASTWREERVACSKALGKLISWGRGKPGGGPEVRVRNGGGGVWPRVLKKSGKK